MSATDVKPDMHTIEELDWVVPCKPVWHECDQPADWAYEHTRSCGCHWEVFYCSSCREKQLARLAALPSRWVCSQCGTGATSVTSKWWPLHA